MVTSHNTDLQHSHLADGHSTSTRSTLARVLHDNALALVLFAFFIISIAGQIGFGLSAYNREQLERGAHTASLGAYLVSGHFLEALFENWESEFLQMGVFVWLSSRLVQKGSAESKPIDEPAESAGDPREKQHEPGVPWPVRRGGWVLWLYERSLAIAFALLFVVSFALHAYGGLLLENEERMREGLPPEGPFEFAVSSQFWYESFQNWQSEFLSVFAVVVLTIFLRQRGSPQSKPVAAPHSETGS
jgi:hypothetical protein